MAARKYPEQDQSEFHGDWAGPVFACILGSALAGRLADVYGRRNLLLAVSVLFATTSAATGLAPTFSAFIAARFFSGLAVGVASLVAPMYVCEVSPPTLRGRMGTLYQLSIVTGIVVSYCINYSLRNVGPDNFPYAFNRIGKAVTFGFLAVISLMQAIFTWRFVPETKNKPLEEIEAFWARTPSGTSVAAEHLSVSGND